MAPSRTTTAALTALVTGSVLFTLSTPASAATAAWRNVSTPKPARPGALNKVDAVNSTTAWALGSENSGATTAIYAWRGSSWKRQTAPAQLIPTGIAGSDAKHAWAVGYDTFARAVALYWNGTKWAKVTYPGVGVPTALSASSDGGAWSISGVDASGGGLSTLLRWNGKAWAKVAIPLPPSSSMTTVGARSKKDVWVGGTYTDGITVFPLAMHWNGTSWKQIKVPGNWGTPSHRNVMQRIVPVSATSVWAIRSQFAGSLLHWNGKKWGEAGTPGGAQPYSLTDDGKGGAWVVPVPSGQTRSRYFHWSGGAWKTLYGPARGATTSLNDIDRLPGGATVLGVGTIDKNGAQAPIIEYYR